MLRLALSAVRPAAGSLNLLNQAPEHLLRAKPNMAVVRNYARGPVRTRAPVEQQTLRAPSLKEKLMGPPSANGKRCLRNSSRFLV